MAMDKPAIHPNSVYTLEIAEKICEGISEGLSLRKAAKAAGIDYKTAIRWQFDPTYTDFGTNITRARDNQADYLADDIISIADDETIAPESRKVMIYARQWVASKLKPKKYGDRQIVDQNVTVTLASLVEQSYKTVEHVSAPLAIEALAVTEQVKPTRGATSTARIDELMVEGEESAE